MNKTNRREFLRVAASAGAVAAVVGRAQLHAESEAAPGPVRAWITTKDKKFQPIASPPQWGMPSEVSALGVHLNPSARYQELVGFGGAFTDASCYLMNKMAPDACKALLADLYGPAGLRLSVGRTCIGSSDYTTEMYSYDDGVEDPELKRFSIDHDRPYLLPILRQARELNPDLYLFSCVWSPPGWMKAGGSMLGGSIRERWFPALTQYFLKFLQGYADAGVKIQAVTVNNEVDTDQDGGFPATLWGQQYEMGFVREHLGPALEKAALETKIWILDHNYDLWGRAVDELSDPGVSKYVDGVAWHSYAGNPDAMSRVHDMFPTKHQYFTEGGPTRPAFMEALRPHAGLMQPPPHPREYPPYGSDWTRWSNAFTDMLRNWARMICVWNLLLDQNGRPDISTPPRPNRPGGLVSVDTRSQQLSYSGNYYAFAHYSKLINRGAYVFATAGDLPGINHVAAENTDGSRVLVLTNNDHSQEQRVQCTLESRALDLVLPPDSITSLVWS
jgi:glucosylceramidase